MRRGRRGLIGASARWRYRGVAAWFACGRVFPRAGRSDFSGHPSLPGLARGGLLARFGTTLSSPHNGGTSPVATLRCLAPRRTPQRDARATSRWSGRRRTAVRSPVASAAIAEDWREKSKPIAPGGNYPAKEHCSQCGLCDTYYIAHVKDACAFPGDGMSRIETLEPTVHGRGRDLGNDET